MKKRALLIFAAVVFAVGVYFEIMAAKTAAQCGCSCAMTCATSCEASCYGCTLGQAIDTAIACCNGAAEATGPLPACGAN